MFTLLLLACTGGEPSPPAAELPPGAPFALRRLNRAEYDRTLRDLLGVSVSVAAQLPPDDSAGGFDNAAAALATSPLHVELWEQGAAAAAQQILDEPLAAPVDLRLQGEAGGWTAADNPWIGPYDWGSEAGLGLWSGGVASALYEVPESGRWRLTARVRADHAGPDGVSWSLLVDGVTAHTAAIPLDQPGWVESSAEVDLQAGTRQLSLSYDNDYDDELLGDRNMYLDWLRIEGPLDFVVRANPARERFITCDPAEGEACARAILARFADRAWRRPVTDDEVERLVGLWREVTAAGDPPEWGLEMALRAALLSPHFLMLVEDPSATEVGPHELASRLSYFLWSSMPDDALRARADDGSLLQPAILAAEAHRMLRDPKARALSEDLAGQWLGVRMVRQTSPDPWVFPAYNATLRESMALEMESLFATFVGSDRSMRELLTTEWAWLDRTMGRFYGVPIDRSDGVYMRNVAEVHRGGWLSQAGLLMATSYPTRTSPVRRGVWVLGNLLCDEPEPPPPGVEGFPEPDAELTTIRDRLEAHRRSPACATCHNDIDAIGLAFEHYDGVGAWRELDEDGLPVDASGQLPDGPPVDGVAELSRAIAEDPRYSRCITEKLFSYAHHRVPTAEDEPHVEALHTAFVQGGMTLDALVAALVTSPTFRQRHEVTP